MNKEDCNYSKECAHTGTDECNHCTRSTDYKNRCPSKYPCPFKQFGMKGMECTRDRYPHLTIFCSLKELRGFMLEEDYGELVKKMEARS
jgi:hypothetical protein